VAIPRTALLKIFKFIKITPIYAAWRFTSRKSEKIDRVRVIRTQPLYMPLL